MILLNMYTIVEVDKQNKTNMKTINIIKKNLKLKAEYNGE